MKYYLLTLRTLADSTYATPTVVEYADIDKAYSAFFGALKTLTVTDDLLSCVFLITSTGVVLRSENYEHIPETTEEETETTE